MIRIAIIIVIGLMTYSIATMAANRDMYHFKTHAQGHHFTQLTYELRCLVCQNENLADSSAPLAADLRQEIADMIITGHTNQEIIAYMVARYGNFVLFKPPLVKTTYLLWFGPFILLLLSFLILIAFIRKQYNIKSTDINISMLEEQRLQKTLAKFTKDND